MVRRDIWINYFPFSAPSADLHTVYLGSTNKMLCSISVPSTMCNCYWSDLSTHHLSCQRVPVVCRTISRPRRNVSTKALSNPCLLKEVVPMRKASVVIESSVDRVVLMFVRPCLLFWTRSCHRFSQPINNPTVSCSCGNESLNWASERVMASVCGQITIRPLRQYHCRQRI